MPAHPEYSPLAELAPELLSAFITTFIARYDCYPRQLPNGSYICVREALTPQLVTAHFRGLITLGAYALAPDNLAHWLCLDADDSDQWEQLIKLASKLAGQAITSYLEPSRRGGHLWLFTSPLPGAIIRQFGQELLRSYDLPKMELYPKQDVLKTGPGSLVRLPFGIHRKTGRRYSFIKPNGEPLALTIREQVALLAHPSRISQTFIDEVVAQIPSTPLPEAPIFAKIQATEGERLSDRIKNSISVYDFVSRYVTLDQRGKGLCPFHDDRVQSFQVNLQENYWSCYAGCGGGSILDFAMKWRDKHGQDASFTATLKDLAEQLF